MLSGGERTRLAVARMLLRPSNTLLLDEPTNHLDLDSKDVLLEALEDFGGTLIFVSHDRYFVDKLATKIVEVGHGTIEVYPGTYEQFLWSKTQRAAEAETRPSARPAAPKRAVTAERRRTRHRSATSQGDAAPVAMPPIPPTRRPRVARIAPSTQPRPTRTRSAPMPQSRRRKRAANERGSRLADLEARIAEREQAIKALEGHMADPGFYEDRGQANEALSKHQQLMWEVGDLMNQWEALQKDA